MRLGVSTLGVVRFVNDVSPHPTRTSLTLMEAYASKPLPPRVTTVPPSTRPPVGWMYVTVNGCTKYVKLSAVSGVTVT